MATVVDPDGYTNVRESPSGSSKIIYQIPTNEVFIIADIYENRDNEWVSVFILKDKFSFQTGSSIYLKGYIHCSRILHLEQTEKYNGEDFKFKYVIKPFNAKGKIFDYYENSKSIKLINGRHPWGTDGDLPSVEIERIEMKVDNHTTNVSKALFADLYECDNPLFVYKKGDTFFVDQSNSDGAGFYNIIWVVHKGEIIQRLIFMP